MSRADRLLEPGRLMSGALVGALLQERLALTELEPGHLLGAFRIERELGRGGMGIVYLATRADGAYEQEVAIKWLPVGEAVAIATDQFRHERQILADLRHPHIARLLDGGCSEDGHLWFAMELVEGQPVDEHVAETGLGWRERVQLLLPVIEAVQFAHAHLLVHRDIKPANVLVDGNNQAMLVDFGIAALLCEVDARMAFTEGYASPEQRQGEPPGIAADVWQLGQLLRCVLTAGQPLPRLPRDLEAILARATHALPARRYGTAAALQADLERLLAHRPVGARPPGMLHRLHLLGQAHPLGTLGSALAILIFIAVVTGFMLRLTHQRNVAEKARANAEAVNAFWEDDLLPGADPLQAGWGKVSVAQLAERALPLVEPRLHAQPEVAAQVELGLAQTLAHLGHFKSAEQAFDMAIDHLVKLYGADDVRVLRARLQREQFALSPSDINDSEARLRKLRAEVLENLGPHSELLLEVDSQLANAAFLRGDFSLCKTRYDALLPRMLYADPVDRASDYMSLSICETRLGLFDAALGDAHTSVTLATAKLGPLHPYTLQSKLALAEALLEAEHYRQSVTVLHKLVGELAQRYGDGHPVTLHAMHDLGVALTCVGSQEAAVTWLRRAVQGRAQVFGPQHPWTTFSESQLGFALMREGHLDQAAVELDKALSALQQHPQTSPYAKATILEDAGDLALTQGHPAAALAKYDAALPIVLHAYPSNHLRLAVLRLSRGLALTDTGHAVAGRALLQQALQHLGNRPGCRPKQLARAHQLLGTPAD